MRARATAWGLAFLLMVATRLLTIAPDPWHWDEVLLTDAVTHGIDLRVHRPHPPGYPLLVELSTFLRRAGMVAYRSLAVVGTAGGILAPLALAWLLREAGLSGAYACAGGLLYAFFPSIWLFGVRGALLILLGALSAALISLAIWWPAVSSSGGMDRFRAQLAIQAADVHLQSLSQLASWATWRRWLVDPLGADAVFWVPRRFQVSGCFLGSA
jgi:hypothetical protein